MVGSEFHLLNCLFVVYLDVFSKIRTFLLVNSFLDELPLVVAVVSAQWCHRGCGSVALWEELCQTPRQESALCHCPQLVLRSHCEAGRCPWDPFPVVTCWVSFWNSVTTSHISVYTPHPDRVQTQQDLRDNQTWDMLPLCSHWHLFTEPCPNKHRSSIIHRPQRPVAGRGLDTDQLHPHRLGGRLDGDPGREHHAGIQRLGPDPEVDQTSWVHGPDVLRATGDPHQTHSTELTEVQQSPAEARRTGRRQSPDQNPTVRVQSPESVPAHWQVRQLHLRDKAGQDISETWWLGVYQSHQEKVLVQPTVGGTVPSVIKHPHCSQDCRASCLDTSLTLQSKVSGRWHLICWGGEAWLQRGIGV